MLVNWEPGYNLHLRQANVASGILRIVRTELLRLFPRQIGNWVLRPIGKVGAKSAPFQFRRIFTDHATRMSHIRVLVRPFDRDSCWEIRIDLPPDMNLEEVATALKGKKMEQPGKSAEPTPQPEIDSQLAVGKIFTGVVAKVEHFGVFIRIPEFKVEGLIPTAELAQQYDASAVNKWREGDKIRVMLMDLTGNMLKFSKRMADISTETTRVDDVYTGVPDRDGLLRLEGYSNSLQRRVETLRWLAEAAAPHYPNPVPKNEAVEHIRKRLVDQTNAKDVEARGIATIIATFERTWEWVKITRDAGGVPIDYSLTDFGWKEIGGVDAFRDAKSKPTAPMQVPEPIQVAIKVDPTVVQPKIEPKAPKVEPKPEPPVMRPPPPTPQVQRQQPKVAAVLENAAPTHLKEYITQISKLASVCASIATKQQELANLEAQRKELEDWLAGRSRELASMALTVK